MLSLAGCSSSAGRPTYQANASWPALPAATVLGQVSGVGVDAHDDVFVFRRADREWHGETIGPSETIADTTILHLDSHTGTVLDEWGADFFLVPHGLTVDDAGHLWLTDVRKHQVFEFTANGEQVRALGVVNEPGADETHFNEPTDVAIANDGSIFISDGYGNSRVVKYSAAGEYLLEWGTRGSGPGQFNVPHGIAIDRGGLVYVADRGNARVQIFDQDGVYIHEWLGEDLGRPWSLAFDRDGLAYVVDGGDQVEVPPDRSRIVCVDPSTGTPLYEFGAYGSEPGQFIWPHDIAIASDGTIYVAEVGEGKRVQQFTP